jgi:UDP:flavonoid glycosyltransferase YjiC (YdhE family)
MKFVLVGYGSRGDVEPCAAVGRELRRRGHDVRMAVSPDMVGLVEAAGVERLGVGAGRPFVATTSQSLAADLCSILTPECAARAREVASRVTPCVESLTRTADLVEDAARSG